MSNAQRKPSAAGLMALLVRREIGHYLGTWSGYIILAGLLLISGLCYNVFAVGSTPKYSADVLSDFFFWSSGATIATGLFLAMRLIAEERQTGTLPLLTTSSLSEGQIIFAKYVSAMVMVAIYLALTLFMPLLVFYNGAISLGHIFAGYVGLLCIGSAGVAIGMFGSALVRSQLLALIISAVITVVLLLMWMSARVVEGTLGDIVGQLSLHDKQFRPFMDGTVTLPNLIYYASLSIVFLFASRNVLESRRWRM
jgi:ABC-2 type transport system permease protein